MKDIIKERKFTIGKLEIRPLSTTDILWLILIGISVIIHLFLKYYCPCKDFMFRFFTIWFIAFQTISSPFGIRFRSIYFSFFWMICCLLLIDSNFLFTYVPLFTFLLYHIIRLFYHKKYNREFIPYWTGKGSMWRHTSKIENASSKLEDKSFTKRLLIIGILIILLSLFSINKQIPPKELSCGICEKL